MSRIQFQEMHGHRIRVLFTVQGESRTVSGLGTYEKHAKLGAVLRIDCEGDPGTFALMLEESRWNGKIIHCATLQHEFEIELGQRCRLSPAETRLGIGRI